MTGVIQGNDVLMELHDGDSYKVFVCAKDMSITYNTTYVNITTYGDGMWDKFAKQSDGYTVSLSGVAAFKNNAMTVWDLLERQLQGLETKFRIIFTDEQNQNTRVAHGWLFQETTTISANVGSVVNGDLSLIGNGALRVVSCAAQIGSVTAEVFDTTSVEVTINDVDGGTPAYYIYQVDNDYEQTTVTNPFTIVNQSGGFHNIIVTPVCADGNRGLESLADYYIQVVIPPDAEPDPDNPVCPNVTGLGISNITYQSFRVSWTAPVQAGSVNVFVKNLTTQGVISLLNQSGAFVDVTGLNPSIEYEVRIVTNCNDNTQSSGITANATTGLPPSGISGTIYNTHPTRALETLVFSEGDYDVTYGAVPVLPNSSAGITNVPYGLTYVTIAQSGGGDPGLVTIITESQQFSFYGDNVQQVMIGNGGISITITP